MQELKRTLAQEQPVVNAALDRMLAALPGRARPVAAHVLAAGGKRLRPLLTLLTGRLFGCPKEELYTLGAAVELLHAATLLHDDILDNAGLRRGKPAAHTVFDPTSVVLAGDAMLARALLSVAELGDTRLTACISEAVMRTAEGEIAEFDLLRDTAVAHDDYLAVITGKTAWMLRASCELGALYAGAPQELCAAAARFGLELGIAFQMVDDVLDFMPAQETGKPRGGDVREGKLTPPLILYMQALTPEQAAAFRGRFAADAFTPEELEAVCDQVVNGGYAQKARDMAGAHLARAEAELALFPDKPERALLRQMVDYVQRRER